MKKLFNVMSLVLMLSMILTAVVFADNIYNDVSNSSPKEFTITTGEPGGVLSYWVDQRGRDCNIGGGISVEVTINTPDNVTATPAILTFDDCGEEFAQDVTFKSNMVGSYDIPEVSVDLDGFNLPPTKFTLIVEAGTTPPEPTIPEISYTLNPAAPDGDNDWYVSPVSIVWDIDDPDDIGTIQEDTCVDQTISEDTSGITLTCVVIYGEGGDDYVSESVFIKLDATPPIITAALTGQFLDDVADTGWWNIATGAPTVTYTCDDLTSGVASCTVPHTFGEGANQSHTGTAVDYAGNSETATVTGVNVDLTAPGILWSNGPEDGKEYYFGFVPEAPSCVATDALSGPDDCTVTGYGTTVGQQTLIATAYDVAGNSTVETRTYTVLAWTGTGFYRPVDMDRPNTIKGGRTVPLKFNVYAGETELTDPAVVKSLTWIYTGGETSVTNTNVLEEEATGGTILRYSDGQFIFNWKTPTARGQYVLILKIADNVTSIVATFNVTK